MLLTGQQFDVTALPAGVTTTTTHPLLLVGLRLLLVLRLLWIFPALGLVDRGRSTAVLSRAAVVAWAHDLCQSSRVMI